MFYPLLAEAPRSRSWRGGVSYMDTYIYIRKSIIRSFGSVGCCLMLRTPADLSRLSRKMKVDTPKP